MALKCVMVSISATSKKPLQPCVSWLASRDTLTRLPSFVVFETSYKCLVGCAASPRLARPPRPAITSPRLALESLWDDHSQLSVLRHETTPCANVATSTNFAVLPRTPSHVDPQTPRSCSIAQIPRANNPCCSPLVAPSCCRAVCRRDDQPQITRLDKPSQIDRLIYLTNSQKYPNLTKPRGVAVEKFFLVFLHVALVTALHTRTSPFTASHCPLA